MLFAIVDMLGFSGAISAFFFGLILANHRDMFSGRLPLLRPPMREAGGRISGVYGARLSILGGDWGGEGCSGARRGRSGVTMLMPVGKGTRSSPL